MMEFKCKECGVEFDVKMWRIYRCPSCNGIDYDLHDKYVSSHPICQKELKKILDYDPEMGIFTWKTNYYTHCKGEVAGLISSSGYIYIGIGCRGYQAHRLVFLWCFGYLPENIVDHIDRDKKNNRPSNLREVSHSCNMRNKGISKNHKTGIKGVCQSSGKYNVTICGDYLGRYKSLLDAAKVRYAAEKEYNFIDCDKNSTALRYIQNNKKEVRP